jgi:hypothetical protein
MRKIVWNRKTVSITLAAVIVPVSLLVAFGLNGMLTEPQAVEKVAADTVYWNMTRPAGHVTIDEWVRSLYTDGVASIGLDVHVSSYTENEPTSGDHLKLWGFVTANVSGGFIGSVSIKFSQIDADAFLDIIADVNDPFWVELHNLTIRSVNDGASAYIDTVAINQPRQCSLKMAAFWEFSDENDVSHWITATLEVTYFNGTAHRKATISMCLGVLVS